MQYSDLSIRKQHFIVTPSELRILLEKFHHVVTNTGVHPDYAESDPNDFFFKYDALYGKLKSGEKLVWKNDSDIVLLTTGITQHLENCLYLPTSKLSVPNFSEPCPLIHTFCFCLLKEQLSTSFSVTQFPENVCGLCLSFPTRIKYESETPKHSEGIVLGTDLDDFETYEELLSGIKSITKPIKLELNGKVHRTAVRISIEAKTDFSNFYFVTQNNIKII